MEVVEKNLKKLMFGGVAELLLNEEWELLDSYAYDERYPVSYAELYTIEDYVDDFIYIIPGRDVGKCSLVIQYNHSGYIEETINIDNGRLLKNYKQYSYTLYCEKLKYGLEPVYNYNKHKLSWRVTADFEDGSRRLKHEEIFLTREGYLRVVLTYTSVYLPEELVNNMEKLVTITEGNKYTDFDYSTDEVSDDSFMGTLNLLGIGFNWDIQPETEASSEEPLENKSNYQKLRKEEERLASRYSKKD